MLTQTSFNSYSVVMRRWARGLTRPRSATWYRAMAVRLRCAAYTCEGEKRQALLDRALDCSYLARRAV